MATAEYPINGSEEGESRSFALQANIKNKIGKYGNSSFWEGASVGSVNPPLSFNPPNLSSS
jgi:hypothetical protein